jgi:hypothetical protein
MKNQMHDNHRGLNIRQLKKLLGSLPVVGAPEDLETRLMRDIRAAQKKSPTAAPRHLFPRYTLVSRSRRRRLTGTSSTADLLRGGLLATVAALLLVSAWANFGDPVEQSVIDADRFVPAVIDMDSEPQAVNMDTDAAAPRMSTASRSMHQSRTPRNGVAADNAQTNHNTSGVTSPLEDMASTPEMVTEKQRVDSTPSAISAVDSATGRTGIRKVRSSVPEILPSQPGLISLTPSSAPQPNRDTVAGVQKDTPQVKTGQPVDNASQRQTGPNPIRK